MMSVTNLPVALLSKCMSFIGEGDYIYIAGTCHSFRDSYISYLQQTGKSTTTTLDAMVESVSRLKMKLLELDIDIHDLGNTTKIRLDGKRVVDFWTAVVLRAAYKGNLDVLVWIKSDSPVRLNVVCGGYGRISGSPCNEAARGGQLKVLQWLRSDAGGKCGWNKRTCTFAAGGNHLELLKWARQNDCPWNAATCSSAALNGHLDLLKWVRKKGCLWNTDTCAFAAQNGHLEILIWARQNGCPWNKSICNLAAQNGHLELLK